MGWTLTSRETKNCGCVEETHVHDDFPTSDTSLILCKECKTKQVEEEKRRAEEEAQIYNKFIQAINNIETKLVPRKEVYPIMSTYRFRFKRSTFSVFNYQLLTHIFKYQKIRNRYYINIHAVQLFYEHELDKYYYLNIR